MMFTLPPKLHVLRNIRNQSSMLGFHYKNNSYLLGMIHDMDAVYITRMITDNVVGIIEDFTPDYPDENFDKDYNILLLHDNIRLTMTKEESPQFDWMVESIDATVLLAYPREKYVGLILPTKKTNETREFIEYSTIVIEPIFDPKTFKIEI